MKKFLLILFLGSNIFSVYGRDVDGPTGEITGNITAEGESVPNITIIVKGTNIVIVTDAMGDFTLSNVPEGKVVVMIKGSGFISQERKINVEADKTSTLNVDIVPDYINIDQVVVSSNKTEMNRANAPVLVNVISPKIMKVTGAVCGADVLNFQPSLRVENNCQNCGFTQLRMNGLEGAYSQILINSRPIFSAMNGVYGLEQIPAQMIDRIEVVRGGGSALFGGNAIGGTVNIITKEPTSNSYQVNGTYSLIEAETPDYNLGFNTSVVSRDLKSGLFVFGLRRDRQEHYANSDDFSEVPMLKTNAYGFNAFHKFTSQSKISLNFHNLKEYRRGGNKFMQVPHLTDITEELDHDIIGGDLTYDYLSKDYKTKLSVFTSAQHTIRKSYYGAERDPAAYGRTTDISWVVGSQFSHNFDRYFPMNLVTGVENVYSKLNDTKLGFYDQEASVDVPDREIVHQEISTPGAYLQTEWNFEPLKVLVGARYDMPDKKLGVKPVFMPRANLLYKIKKISTIRLSYARGYRSPQLFDEDLHIEASGARTHVHAHSDSLISEYSNSLSGSADLTLIFNKIQMYFLTEFFYTKLENPFTNEYVFDEVTELLTLVKINAKTGAYVTGANFEAKFAFSKLLEIQAGATVQKSLYEEAQPWGEDENLTTKNFLRTPDQYGYVVVNVIPVNNFNISLSGNYTGPMWVPHLAGGLDPNYQLITKDVLLRTKSFFDAGVNISKRFVINREFSVEINAGVKNIFNSYQDDFDIGVNRDAGFVYGPLLPRAYMVGIKFGNF